jgi:hypothetical protein
MHEKIDTAALEMILPYIKSKHNSAEPAKTRFDQGICRDLWQIFCYTTIILENDNNKGTPYKSRPKRDIRMSECTILSLYYKSN